jgi:RNA polymerase-binding transcription factor DksA
MKCINHPETEAVTTCWLCDNPICAECRTVVKGKDCCIKCQERWLEQHLANKIDGAASIEFDVSV